jgi:hypothetical protein
MGDLNIDTDFSEPFQGSSGEFQTEGCQGGCQKNIEAEEDFGLNSTVFSNNNNNGDFN